MNGEQDRELDDTDKALLKDIQAFNQRYAATGWHIRDKVVKEDLSRVVLSRSSMTLVQFQHVNWQSAVLIDTQFTNVEFQQAQFTSATLRGVVFKDCKFVLCSFAKAKLTDCKFITSTAEELNARDAMFERCVFESFQDNTGVFGAASMSNCIFERCSLDNSSFYSVKFNSVPFKQSDLKNVIFASIQGSELSLHNSVLFNCSFEGSNYGTLTLEGGQSKGVTFKRFNAENLTIQKCEKIAALTVRESTWEAAAMTGCNAVSELTINQSRMRDFTLSRNQIAYLEIKETEISGNSHVTDCAIAGLNLERSVLLHMQMVNCTLASYLIADGATLNGVVLKGLIYVAGLTMSMIGVNYINGTGRFGEP